MIKDIIQLGHYAFIEVPDKRKADTFITDIGIASHKWSSDDIQYGFSRYGIQNNFCINFYVAVGFHYHIYNVFVEAIEADCYGVVQVGGAFWEENIMPEKYSDASKIKPKTDYVVVKLLLTYPLKHISEIIDNCAENVDLACNASIETKYTDNGLKHSYLGKEIGENWNVERIKDFRIAKYNDAKYQYDVCLEYKKKIMPYSHSSIGCILCQVRAQIALAKFIKNKK